MASKTFPVTIRGRFVCSTLREWNGFKADDGKEVAAGSSVSVHILDAANNLREIKCNGIPGIDRYGFGVEVICEAEARSVRSDVVFTAFSLVAASTVAPAAVKVA